MHELAICQSLMSQVEDIARSRNRRRVSSIVIGLGPLSGVEADLLENAYSIARAGSVASDAELVIEHLPLIVRCTQCGSESEALPNRLLCAQCGDWRTTLISGDEMMLMSVVLEDGDSSNTENRETQPEAAASPVDSLPYDPLH